MLEVFQPLMEQGGTAVAIEHDLDVMGNADYLTDLGREAGKRRLVAAATLEQVLAEKEIVTGRLLAGGRGRARDGMEHGKGHDGT
ncbi:MAG TPA: hypothetical protein IAC21_08030 [Candidatus Enterenecus merdae]|nr:hypothetical protein [Candidatus Enterenecus merdae]